MACFPTNMFNTGFLCLCFLCSLLAIVCLFVCFPERERGVELDEWGGGEGLEGVGGRERGDVERQIIIKMHCMKK